MTDIVLRSLLAGSLGFAVGMLGGPTAAAGFLFGIGLVLFLVIL